MGSIIDRALDIINDHLKDQTSSFKVGSPLGMGQQAMARGGYVLEDDYPTHYLPHVGRQVMAKGGAPKKGFEGRVSKPPPKGPTSWEDVPTINPDDLVGKKIFPIFADLTKTGDPFMGIDASQLERGVPMRGGPGYPLIPENVEHEIAWAVEGKGRGTSKLGKDADYAVVMAMNPDTHKSNASFSRALIGNMQAYVRDGRLPPENLQQLNDLVREPGTQKELQSLHEFPGFEHPDAVDFIDNLSFEARKRISDVLGSPGGQKLGAPNVSKIIRETADPRYAGVDRSAGLFLMELHPEKGLSNLKEEGLPEHESYTYGVPGRIVGKFHHPVAAEVLFKNYFDKKKADTEASIIGNMQKKATDKEKGLPGDKVKQLNDMVKSLGEDESLSSLKNFPGFEHEDFNSFMSGLGDNEKRSISGMLLSDAAQKIGAPKSNLRRAFDLEMPVGEITQEIADMLPRHPKDIQSSQAARLALNVLHDRWHTSDDPVKEGGISAANFSQALKDSDASSTLTQYSQKELNDMTKSGKFKAFKLKDGEVYFGLKHGTDYKDEYGFEHPELTPNETALVSVVNNEPGAKGIGGAPVVLKAIEHGATALDAFAVPSKKHPEGFLPDFYSHFGFKELGRVPFDPKYVSEQQLADMKHYWTKNGWDESMGLPSLAIMKWTGTDDDRKDALRRYLEKGSAGDRQGANPVDVLSAAGSPESGAPEAGGEEGLGGEGVGRGNRGAIRTDSGARPSDRLSRTLAAVRGLAPTEAPHFGLTPEDITQAQTAFEPPAKAYGGAINPIELRDDPEDMARRLILWSYAVAPVVRPLSRAEGGTVDDPVNKALSVAGASQPNAAQKAVETARSLTPMGFYSAAAEAASKIPQRAPIDQIINKVKGSPGVKAEELDQSGVRDAFAGQKSVDPKEVARHFQENLPEIKEQIYGGAPLIHRAEEADPEAFFGEDVPSWLTASYVVGPRFKPREQYVIHEAGMTRRQGDNPEYYLKGPRGDDLGDFESLEAAEQAANDAMMKRDPVRYREYALPGGEKYREVVMHMPKRTGSNEPVFKSNHWPQENVLAHLRMSDRMEDIKPTQALDILNRIAGAVGVSPDRISTLGSGAPDAAVAAGAITPEEAATIARRKNWHSSKYIDKPGLEGKVLHVDEIQSDWAQKGRDEGFHKGPTKQLSGEVVREEGPEDRWRVNWEDGSFSGGYGYEAAARARLNQGKTDEKPGVPVGPHVTDTNSWTDLALKRALKEAAEGGYDKMVWTPGETQAERYSLSNHVHSVAYDPEKKTLSFISKSDPLGFGYQDIPGNVELHEIAKHIGKEAAKRLLETEPHPLSGNHILEGEDLKVGGHGMTEYYDRIVPSRLQALVKKLDPEAKINLFSHDLPAAEGKGTIKGHALHLTPKLREAIMKGLPAYEQGGSVDRTKLHYKDVTKRVPQLTEAAASGVGGSEYQDLVNIHKPVQVWNHVPPPASFEEMHNALEPRKREKLGRDADIPEGHPVGLRLDIPAYRDHGVWIPTIHDRSGGSNTVLAHAPHARVSNATFNIPQKKAEAVAKGGPKSPFATIDGSWKPTSVDDAQSMAETCLNHPDWRQVGMDPERHSYFYDRETQEPITHAEEVLQVGPLVLAKNPRYGNREDYSYERGGSIIDHAFKVVSRYS